MDSKARNILRQAIINNAEIDKTIIDNLSTLQQSYFSFVNKVNPHSKVDENRLNQICTLDIEGREVLLNLINTAWISQKEEKQGDLFFPVDELNHIDIKNYDLVISVFHHPYNWLNADNKRLFKDKVEKCSDIILTGHEHVSEQVFIVTNNEHSNNYYHGTVLQNSENDESFFNMIVFNLEELSYTYTEYYWNGNYYAEKRTETKSFQRNILIKSQQITISENYLKKIKDIGQIGRAHV